jgi:dTMP kinase
VILGIEGVSCAGKTTLARALAPHLDNPVIIPCYYHVAPDPTKLPTPRARTARQQLAGLAHFLELETVRLNLARAAEAEGRDVILDRTVDTVLAHAHAVGRLAGFDCDRDARSMVARQAVAIPDLTLALTADPGVLAARATRRPGLPSIFYDAEFSEHFNAYFHRPLALSCTTLDTTADPPERLVTAALVHITRHRAAQPSPPATHRGDAGEVTS